MATQGTVRTASLTTSASALTGFRSDRVALLLSPPVTGSYTVGTQSTVVSGAGINLLSGSGSILLDRATYGDLVTGQWYAVASASMTIGFVEVAEQ